MEFGEKCSYIIDLIDHLIPEAEFLETTKQSVIDVKNQVESTKSTSGGGTFEWVDSPLVQVSVLIVILLSNITFFFLFRLFVMVIGY